MCNWTRIKQEMQSSPWFASLQASQNSPPASKDDSWYHDSHPPSIPIAPWAFFGAFRLWDWWHFCSLWTFWGCPSCLVQLRVKGKYKMAWILGRMPDGTNSNVSAWTMTTYCFETDPSDQYHAHRMEWSQTTFRKWGNRDSNNLRLDHDLCLKRFPEQDTVACRRRCRSCR